MERILLVEDDRILNDGICYNLIKEGYEVEAAYSREEGIKRLELKRCDLVLLDVGLPDGDGFSFCRWIHQKKGIPVIFLTACDLDEDVVRGFEEGADDYITKPFHLPILLKRVRAVLRRTGKGQGEIARAKGVEFDFENRKARKGEEEIHLTSLEFELLRLLWINRHQVMTKGLILEKLWDQKEKFSDEHALTAAISRLRKKLEAVGTESPIKTVYGIGYQWEEETIWGDSGSVL